MRALGGALPAGVDSDKVRVVRVEGGAPLIVGERIDGVDSVDGLSGCSAAATKEPSALLDTPQSTHADARRVHLVIVKDGRISFATPASKPGVKKRALALEAAATIPLARSRRMPGERAKSCMLPEIETMTSGLGTRQ